MTEFRSDQFEELTRFSHSGVEEVLGLAMGHPTPTKIRDLLQRYAREDTSRLYAHLENGAVVGLVGTEALAPAGLRIRHLAVRPDFQGRGLARALVTCALTRANVEVLYAETDSDAVGFYRACGFSVQLLASEPHGRERFGCTWTLLKRGT